MVKECYIGPKYYTYQIEDYSVKKNNSNLITETLGIFGQNKKTAETEDILGTLARTATQEERAFGAVAKNISKTQRGAKTFLQSTRGAAYANDVGEGLKPAIGEALSKRFWYPALAYVGCSVIDKTLHDENGNKDISLKRGAKEMAFQTLASLVGPILLVNVGQNTIGKGLNECGSLVGAVRKGQNPFQNMSVKSLTKGTENTAKAIGKGVFSSFVDLPGCIGDTVKMFCKDVSHPVETAKKVGNMTKQLGQSLKTVPVKIKQMINFFKQNKWGAVIGKDGILFGSKGLFGESGLLFGPKSSKVIGGLLAILLLYKVVDKASEKIVDGSAKLLKNISR